MNNASELKNLTVNEFFKKCNIGNILPISFDNISKDFNVIIKGMDFKLLQNDPQIEAIMQGKGTILGMAAVTENGNTDSAEIFYNNNVEISIPTQRFIIAHELGHIINHFDIMKNGVRVAEFCHGDLDDCANIIETSCQSDLHEVICNKFARDFLIPTDLLQNFINLFGTNNKNLLSDLSNLFLVPETEMEIKLKEIGCIA